MHTMRSIAGIDLAARPEGVAIGGLHGHRMTSFTPPPAPPPVVEIASPEYGSKPVRATSHGYQYIVTGNTLLPPQAIEQAIASGETPKDVLGNLQRVYHEHGYTLVAITGEEDGKIVRVSVFQGTLSEVKIPEGLGWFFPDLQWRNNLRSDELVKNHILADAYAGRSGQKIDVSATPAANPGGTAFTVSETPLPDYSPVTGSLNFGNYGSRYSSGYIAGGDAAANLTNGVQITANYVRGLPGLREESFGSTYYQAGTGISVVTPYGVYGFTASGTHFREGQATAPLFPTGDILAYALQGTQLLYADTATRLSVTESLNRTAYTETVLSDLLTLLRQNYNYATVGTNLSHAVTLFGQQGNLTAGTTLNVGLSPPSGTLVDGEPGVPTSHFRYLGFSAGYVQHLPLDFQANLTGQAQWSLSTVPSQQQWTLGGFGNLSAWEPGVVVGDSGYVARLEVSAPTVERFNTSAQFSLFIETGGAAFRTPAPGSPPWQRMSDAGISLRLTLPYKFTATAMAAIPVATNGFDTVSKNSLNANRINCFFVIQKRF